MSIHRKEDELRKKLDGLIDAYQETALVHFMAKINLAEYLKDQELDTDTVAHSLNIDHSLFLRVAKGLEKIGLCKVKGSKIKLTKMGRLMEPSPDKKFHHKVLVAVTQWLPSWNMLDYSVKKKLPAFSYINELDPWAFRKKHPTEQLHFNAWLSQETAQHAKSIALKIKMPPKSFIVDIAGGDGTLLSHILNRYKKAKGMLFELPHVIKNNNLGNNKSMEYHSGDFFKPVDIFGDIFLLKSVLHDWSDGNCIKILRNIRHAMHDKSKLFIIERLLNDDHKETIMLDLRMLSVTGGQERDIKDFSRLTQSAGLSIQSKTKTASGFYLIECRKT
jgi:predicted transcriptional regulator